MVVRIFPSEQSGFFANDGTQSRRAQGRGSDPRALPWIGSKLEGKARQLFDRWTELDRYLLVKYIDGNLKSETEPGKFLDNGNGRDIPDKIQFPGYNEKWKRAVVADHGEVLKVIQ